MIKVGQFTMIDGKTYQVVKIDDNFAHLHDVKHYKGRPRKMILSQVPYFDENGTLVEPVIEKTKVPLRKFQSKINLRDIIKETTDGQFSRKGIMFLHEQLTGLAEIMIINAFETAEKHGHKRVGAEHFSEINFAQLHFSEELRMDHKEYIEDGLE